ncbi:DUF86 domain-containing protein [Bacillus lacus]|uniref:DUF86 domain-containing protein n=1 Tax=Metabacillus lacus TaxID=1983721 RepID=A0A7X2J169_9BACI|nr:DUF86 domain-containing protein [Metabacillus lacus]MRX73227.1 DUF86 domain-containing protein [Metabacillus lacus]
MYFVDREKIEATLVYLDSRLQLISGKETWENAFELLALERAAHMIIESILDTGNAMIDGFIMRDPGSYEDIIDILLDEKVVPVDHEGSLKEVVSLRKVLVQQYLDINHSELSAILHKNMGQLSAFSTHIRRYLENELGPVSAFKPK